MNIMYQKLENVVWSFELLIFDTHRYIILLFKGEF